MMSTTQAGTRRDVLVCFVSPRHGDFRLFTGHLFADVLCYEHDASFEISRYFFLRVEECEVMK
jgi:hypothetical protein